MHTCSTLYRVQCLVLTHGNHKGPTTVYFQFTLRLVVSLRFPITEYELVKMLTKT